MTQKTIYIASDHRGVALKSALSNWLQEQGYNVVDMGTNDDSRVNASEYAVKVVEKMRGEETSFGVLICGTGQAMTMTSNRFKHIRAAMCTNSYLALLARQHNDANVLTLGSEIVGEGLALDILETFLKTEAFPGRYRDRCQLLTDLGGL